ncbi:L,D-transpeptidase family protein [Clostridium sp. MSJ-4]|uniref:L,D-transpeptidase family protein n=1 Tax=Clostridium simiarum TaxID=2841506 RepID=A0ABS6F677_9CLOT|nr:L,D-transpeptidase [Clostridium simiarum]MBU5593108.1 L,D-transpeptidase family protein [Clostridium simiarum]
MVKYFQKKNLIIIFLILIIVVYSILCLNFYNNNLLKFKKCFDNGEYIKANSIILNEGSFNLIKKVKINNDLNVYFSDFIEELKTNHENNMVSEEHVAYILKEIERYNRDNSKVKELEEALPLLTNSKNEFEKGVELFNNKDYADAMKSFNKVSPFFPEYLEALDYEKKCHLSIKEDTLTKANELASGKYYSKAISLIKDNLDLLKEDKELSDKIREYEDEKNKYITSKDNEDSQAVFKNQRAFSKDTINTFGIESGTNYLVFVSINNQKTYVYKGSKNQWSLVKEFLCSTGVKGNETPKGSFTVKNKGDWFYTPKYEQGAKYWVGFKGNYLFHSLPFDKEKKNVVDTTLGEPASHGCIRLKVDESKWLYDNIPIGSKVVVN